MTASVLGGERIRAWICWKLTVGTACPHAFVMHYRAPEGKRMMRTVSMRMIRSRNSVRFLM
jgi:hypothetical protein